MAIDTGIQPAGRAAIAQRPLALLADTYSSI